MLNREELKRKINVIVLSDDSAGPGPSNRCSQEPGPSRRLRPRHAGPSRLRNHRERRHNKENLAPADDLEGQEEEPLQEIGYFIRGDRSVTGRPSYCHRGAPGQGGGEALWMSWLSESDRVDAEKREAVMNEGSRKREELTGPPLRMNSTFKTKTHDIHIREMLGAGAYGKVYRVVKEDKLAGIQEDQAMKVQPYGTQRQYVDHEVSILKTISRAGHNFFVKLINETIYNGKMLLFMEVMGKSLEEVIHKEEQKELHYIKEISRELLEAVSHLHYLGVVHTDIKPSNVLLSLYRPNEIKICDFGNAQYLDYIGRVQHPLCALGFRPPECYLGGQLNEKVDVWSVGCLLAELYTNSPLFNVSNEEELNKSICQLVGIPNNCRNGRNFETFFEMGADGKLQWKLSPKKSAAKVKKNSSKTSDFIKLEDIVKFGYNFTKKNATTSQDMQFVHILQQLLKPDNSSRISADNALKLRFFW